MSSPRQKTAGSRSISSHSAWRIASRYVTSPVAGAAEDSGGIDVLQRLRPLRPGAGLGEGHRLVDLPLDPGAHLVPAGGVHQPPLLEVPLELGDRVARPPLDQLLLGAVGGAVVLGV